MNEESSFHGTLQHVNAHWPTYLLGYGIGIVAVAGLLAFAGERQWWGLFLMTLALLFILVYFLCASLWAAHEQFDQRQNRPSYVLFEMSRLQPTDDFVYVGLGLRDTPEQLSRRLTSGHLTAIDVYNPQLAPSRALARRRERLHSPRLDPRLSWLDGTIQLLPLPDRSTHTVIINHTLSELSQHGDRLLLLREIFRVLKPGGSLILAEPARSKVNFLVMGPAAFRLESVSYWRRLLQDTGFRIRKEQDVHQFYDCFRAERPHPGEMQQLTLDLGV